MIRLLFIYFCFLSYSFAKSVVYFLSPRKTGTIKGEADMKTMMDEVKFMNNVIERAHRTAVEKGWWDDADSQDGRNREEAVALIHSEVSEALEHYRDGRMAIFHHVTGKPDGFPVEMADVIVRCADLMGRSGFLISTEANKNFFNPSEQIINVIKGKKASAMLTELHRIIALGAGEHATHTDGCFERALESVIWSVYRICKELDVDLEQAIELKMAYNETRPYRHGGRKA